MSVENEINSQKLNDYKKKFSDEKQKFGLKDEDDDDKSDEEKYDRDNMGGYPGTGDESENHRIKLSNERKQDYIDYLSNKNDNFTKPNEYFEDVNPDTFLGFGESQGRHERHKNVITTEKRQISHDQLADERKQEYQTYLSKNDVQFSKPDEYFEKVNADSFLGFGEGGKQPTHGTHGRKKVNLHESRETAIEKLQNSLQQASISTYGSLNLSNFEQKTDDNKQQWKVRPETPKNEYQDHSQNQNDKSSNENVPELNAHQRYLAALAHSPLHNQIEEANSQMNREQSLQNQQDEKRRQHEQYSQELSQQIADKKQYNIVKANRERLEYEANSPSHSQTEENYTQIQRKITLQNEDDEKRRQCEEYYEQLNEQVADNKLLDTEKANREQLEDEANLPLHITDQITENDTQINRELMEQDEKKRKNEEYLEQLCQQIEDNKQRKIAKAKLERLEDEAIVRYEHNHAMF